MRNVLRIAAIAGMVVSPFASLQAEERQPARPALWGFEDTPAIERGRGIRVFDRSGVGVDTAIFRSGNQSLWLDSSGAASGSADDPAWVLVNLVHDRREGALAFELFVRSEGAPQPAFLVAVIHAPSAEPRILRFPVVWQNAGEYGGDEWVRVAGTARVDAMDSHVDLGIETTGPARLWLDDLAVTLDGQAYGHDRRESWDLERFAGGSGVSVGRLDAAQRANVAVLARVWGTLKYHLPAAQSGARNWDNEFLALLPAILQAPTPESRDALLASWIRSLGAIPRCSPCVSPGDDAMLAADEPWFIDAPDLSPELRDLLVAVHANRTAHPFQFFAYRQRLGHADFGNELAYRDIDPGDDGFRMLAVARYWNAVRYWFPYRDLIDEPWEPVLEQALGDVVTGDTRQSYVAAMRRLIARIDDTHALMYNDYARVPPAGACFPRPHAAYVEGVPLIVDTGQAEGVQVGDRILAVDGVPVERVEAGARPYYAASNTASFRRDLARNLLRGNCGPLSLTVARGGETLSFELVRDDDGWGPQSARRDTFTRTRSGPALQWPEERLLYVSMEELAPSDLDGLKVDLGNARAAIFDLRGYGGRVSIHALLQVLSPEPVPFAGFSIPNMATPGEFLWEPLSPSDAEHDPARFAGPIAILVDETTQSAAEYVVMGLQSVPGTFTVGSTTAGADGNVTQLSLPGGLYTAFSGLGVFYPDKAPTQQVGVRIDYPVSPTIEGVRSGKDEQLDLAMAQLRTRLSAAATDSDR